MASVENVPVLQPTNPPMSGWRRLGAFAVSGLALAALAAVTGWTADLLYLMFAGGSVLLLAWRAYLGRPTSRPLLAVVYGGCVITGAAATLSTNRWQAFSLILAGTIGTALYAQLRMPLPGDRHAMSILIGGLIMNHNIWLILLWPVIGALLGAAMYTLLRTPRGDELEPPLWLGVAIGGIVCLAIEMAMR